MGDRLGLYRALAGAGPLTPAELAERTGTAERYVREWLNAQAAGGYVDYDATAAASRSRPSRPSRSPTRTARPTCPGFFEIALGSVLDSPRITEAARTRRRRRLARAQPRTSTTAASGSSGPATTPTWSTRGCRRSTASSSELERGARVADVGCGHGASTILMAEAFPTLDVRRLRLPRRVDRDGARRRAARPASRTACASRSRPAAGYSGHGLRPRDDVRLPARHGRPGRRGAPRPQHARAGRHVDDRRAGGGRPRRGQPQPGRPRLLRLLDAAVHAGVALAGRRPGARRPGGPARIAAVVAEAGFTRFRQAAETPFNLVFEARP